MFLRPTCIAVVAAFAAALIATHPASAAIRQCGAIVSSDVVAAPTELAAKKTALDQWRAKAEKMGPEFNSWVVAAEKSLQCFPKGDGFECVAFGAPCVIQQNPNQKPVGKDRKGLPL